MTATAETRTGQTGRRPGLALMSYGFRPFFLAGALYAAAMIGLWVPVVFGTIWVPTAFDPFTWHAYELLFGFVFAIVAGFLLTAVAAWTGRPPVAGWPLACLFVLWLLGRAAVAVSAQLDPITTGVLALAFPIALLTMVGREIIAGRNWRNLKVLAVVGVLAGAQAVVHVEVWHYGRPQLGTNLGMAAVILLIMLIGGRIVPAFTMNWIKRAKPGRLPIAFGAYDRWTLTVSTLALAAWTAAPLVNSLSASSGALLLLAGVMNLWRMVRWAPDRTAGEPLVAVLHVASGFVPLGFVFAGAAHLLTDAARSSAALHAWGVGAIGLMTLAVMTRASRGHTGRPLTAPPGTVVLYGAMTVAAVARIAAALEPAHEPMLVVLAGLGWIGAYLGFAVLYGPILLAPRADG